GGTRLDLEEVRDVEVGDRALPAGAPAGVAFRIGQADGAAAQGGLAADSGFVLDDPAGSLDGLEVPQLDRDMDVLTPGRRVRAGFPERVVEALVASAAVAVPVVEEPCLALGEDRIRLGQFAEPGFGIGGIGNIGMPLPGQAVEGALDRSAVRISREAEHLVVVPLSDSGHLWRIVSYHADAATDSGRPELSRYAVRGSGGGLGGSRPRGRARPGGHRSSSGADGLRSRAHGSGSGSGSSSGDP